MCYRLKKRVEIVMKYIKCFYSSHINSPKLVYYSLLSLKRITHKVLEIGNRPCSMLEGENAKKCSNMIIRGKEARNDIDEPFKSFPVHLTDY